MANKRETQERTETLDGAPLHYAPANEQGVVFLFAHLARKLRMQVDEIRQGFPDCVAFEKTSGGERRVRIEFELRSSAFRLHGHPARGCDCIVCWEHDWPDCPSRLRVIELRRFFGLGFKVWMQPAIASQQDGLDENTVAWAARKSAHRGDLMVMYRCSPEKCIRELFVLRTDLRRGRRDPSWGEGDAFFGTFRIVCRLDAPIFLDDLQGHRHLRTAGFVRARLQGNRDVTAWWTSLYHLIVSRNPRARRALQPYAPERLDGMV